MLERIAILFLLLLAVGVPLYYLAARRRERARRISRLLAGIDVLASWTYSPGQWRAAVEEEFTWAGKGEGGGRVCISPDALYVSSDSGKARLIDLAGGRIVTHASFGGGDMALLKLRVRRKEVFSHPDRADEVKYYRDDYRIPVPAAHQQDARRVVDFFNSRLQNDLGKYADSVPDDEPLSIFGKDPF